MIEAFIAWTSWVAAAISIGTVSTAHLSTLTAAVSLPSAALSEIQSADAGVEGIVFLGDVLLARDVELRQRRYGLDHPFSRISFPPSHLVIGNFESTIPAVHRMTPHLHMLFSSPTSSVETLRTAGVTHVSLANNHTYDFGEETFLHTQSMLRAGSVQPFGHPQRVGSSSVAYVTVHNRKVAILALNAVSYTPSRAAIDEMFTLASAQSDLQIAYVHWGPEYQLVAHASQQATAQDLVDAGADLIIGHHPHVVQNIEYVDGVLVVYSLGNFIFDQYFSRDVQEGLVVVFQPYTDTVQLLPVTSLDSRTQPRYQNEAERLRFLQAVGLRSDPRIRSHINTGVLPRAQPVATSSKTAMISP